MSRTLVVYDDQKQSVKSFNNYGSGRADCEHIEQMLVDHNFEVVIDNTLEEFVSRWYKFQKNHICGLCDDLQDKKIKEILDDGVATIEFILWLKYLLNQRGEYFYIGFE